MNDVETWQDFERASRPPEEQHLRDLALLRRVRDRMDREYAQPLNVEALARGVHMSAGTPQPPVPARRTASRRTAT